MRCCLRAMPIPRTAIARPQSKRDVARCRVPVAGVRTYEPGLISLEAPAVFVPARACRGDQADLASDPSLRGAAGLAAGRSGGPVAAIRRDARWPGFSAGCRFSAALACARRLACRATGFLPSERNAGRCRIAPEIRGLFLTPGPASRSLAGKRLPGTRFVGIRPFGTRPVSAWFASTGFADIGLADRGFVRTGPFRSGRLRSGRFRSRLFRTGLAGGPFGQGRPLVFRRAGWRRGWAFPTGAGGRGIGCSRPGRGRLLSGRRCGGRRGRRSRGRRRSRSGS